MKKFLCICLLVLSIVTPVRADIIISEVYFDDTDERVELYNTGGEPYIGDIVLSGAKASTVTVPNITIPASQAIIVGDTMSMIIDPSSIVQSGLSLNFPDTQAINVQLMSGGDVVSSFSVDTGTMATAKLTNASIHNNRGDNNNYISQSPYIANSTPDHPSNPGIVYTGFITTATPDIIISEVYFEGADERFELTNIGSESFSGTIILNGLSNNTLVMDIQIGAGASLVIADTIASFVDTSMVLLSPQNLVIPDDGNIQATLQYQTQTIDTFDVEESLVAPYIDGHNAFEKVRYHDQLQITVATGDRISNVPAGIIANPGILFTVYDEVVNIGEEDIGQEGDGEQDPTYCTSLGTTIQISEVFFGNGEKAPYIELYTPTGFDQNITLSGSLLDNPITFAVQEEAGDYFMVSTNTSTYIDNNSLHDNQELSIRGELGLLWIYGQDGQVLDIVDIRTLGDKNAVIFSSMGDCQRVFHDTTIISPGFDHHLLQYQPSQTVVYGGGGGGSSCNTPPSDEQSQDTHPSDTGIDIVDIVYDPPGSDTDREMIALRSVLDNDFDLKNLRMAVSTRSGTQALSGTLYARQTQIFTGNFRFPNTSACVSLGTGSQQFDVYCYPTTGDSMTTGDSTTMTGIATPTFTGYFAIANIVYDPEGSDTNNETITFVSSGVSIDENTKLLIGSRSFNMEDFAGMYSGTIILTGNFRFPNSIATCVTWMQGIDVLDTYCYDPLLPQKSIVPDIQITSIVYDPPGSDTNTEQITLELHSPASIDLDTIRLRIGTRTATIHGILTTGSAQTFTDNFRFPNYDACVSVMFEDTILDTLCYQANEEDNAIVEDKHIDYTNTSIDITHVVYNPEGDDTDREEIHLTTTDMSVDLADGFYLMINDTKRYLRSFGVIENDATLISTFNLPNTKNTCISLHREDRIFDTYCYEPGDNDITQTGDIITLPDYAITIVSLQPNPVGKDEGTETITLALSGSNPLDLSQGFYLRINKTKKNIGGILLPGQEQTLTGNFHFPNTAGCVQIEKDGLVFDTFCYEKPEEGDIFTTTQGVLKHISTLDLSILQQSQLTRFADKICLTYEDTTIKCKNTPRKINPNNELKLYKNYVGLVHDYLMGDRNILFYNSPLKIYKNLFDTAKQEVKKQISFVTIDDTRVPVYDIAQRFALQYQQAFVDSFVDSVLSQILGDAGQKQLSIFRDQRFASLDDT